MNPRNLRKTETKDGQSQTPSIENIIERKLEDIATILCGEVNGKSRLYEDVVSMIERGLFRIALKRSNNIKSTAANYLGINRNTFQSKMVKLGINSDGNRQGKYKRK